MLTSLSVHRDLNFYLYIGGAEGLLPRSRTPASSGRLDPGRPEHLVPADAAEAEQFIDIVQADPAVETAVGFTGGRGTNSANVFVAEAPRTSALAPRR
jgi:multidrug efflux pump